MDRKRLTTLFLIVFSDMMGGSAILPILPVLVVGQFQASPLQATLVITIFYVAQVIAAPLLGSLSDRYGRRPILLISQFGTLLSYVLILLAAPLGMMLEQAGLTAGLSGGLLVIYIARIIDGISGGNVSVAQAYASDVSTPEERTRVMGLIGGASGIGHIAGPALAGLLATFALLLPFLAAVVMSVVTLLLTLIWLKEPAKVHAPADHHKDQISWLHVLHHGPVLLLLSLVFAGGLYMAALFGVLGLYTEQVLLPDQPDTLVVATVGVLVTVIGVATTIVQIFLLKPLGRWLGERVSLVLGCALLLVSALGFSFFQQFWIFVACMALFALGTGVMTPNVQSMLTRSGPASMSGRLLGLYQAMFSLSLIIGPLLGGYLFESVAPQAVFWASAVCVGLALLLSLIALRIPLEKPVSQEHHHGMMHHH